MSERGKRVIHTPDQRLRVFVSSTLQELADERKAAREAIEQLRLAPVMFELGARPHPPKDLYRAYLDQSDIFVGIYWQKYGWVAPEMDISGLEDEWRLSGDKPKLIYLKAPAPDREPRLTEVLARIRQDDRVSYKPFASAVELRELIENDLAMILTERFEMAQVSDSAPLESSAAIVRHNLPVPPTPLIGRQPEVAAVHQLLQRADVGLVTLTGPGGTGKTRLAVQVASEMLERFEHGTFFVALAPISDPALVVPTIAQTLGVHETGDATLIDLVKDHLRDQCVLLLLDNFEQVVSSALEIAALLQACPRLKVLVTSRIPLHVRGEREFPVSPLAMPGHEHSMTVDELSRYAAIELFVQRVSNVRPDFAATNETAPVIAEICYRLDGLPLAIELAAARAKVLSPQALLARLEHSLDLLTSGARDLPARQQTLRNAIAWSYGLLEPASQVLFRRLAVFVGGWSLEAVADVCNAQHDLHGDLLDQLGVLIDNSLLKPVEEIAGEPQFGLLVTVREFACEKLDESGEADELRQRHAQYYLALAVAAEPGMRTNRQRQWFERLEAELDNFRAALQWLMEHAQIEAALRLATALWQFMEMRGHWSEGRQWLTAGLERATDVPIAVRAKAITRAAWLTRDLGDYARASAMLRESLELWRQIDDKAGIALTLSNLGSTLIRRGHYDEAAQMITESLALRRELNDPIGTAASLVNLGLVENERGNRAQAIAHYTESHAIARSIGDHDHMIKSLNNLGGVYTALGDYERAAALYQEGMNLCHEVGDKSDEALLTANLGWVALKRGHYVEALEAASNALVILQALGDREFTLGCLAYLANIAALLKQTTRAATLGGAEEALRETFGIEPPESDRGDHDQWVALARSQIDAAAFEAAWQAGRSLKLDQAIAYALER